MRWARIVLSFLATFGLLSGCATAVTKGQDALRDGRYVDALVHFEEALAQEPGRLNGLLGLGISRYKLGKFEAAAGALGDVVARSPRAATARFYLALTYLRLGQGGPAEEHLRAFADLDAEPRLAGQVDRALRVLRADPVEETRDFLVSSLEAQAELVWELRQTELALRDERLRRVLDDRIILFGPGRWCRCL